MRKTGWARCLHVIREWVHECVLWKVWLWWWRLWATRTMTMTATQRFTPPTVFVWGLAWSQSLKHHSNSWSQRSCEDPPSPRTGYYRFKRLLAAQSLVVLACEENRIYSFLTLFMQPLHLETWVDVTPVHSYQLIPKDLIYWIAHILRKNNYTKILHNIYVWSCWHSLIVQHFLYVNT